MAYKRSGATPLKTDLSLRKKVLPGEFLKGFDTVSAHDQSSVFQILTVLSSLCEGRLTSVSLSRDDRTVCIYLSSEVLTNRVPADPLDETLMALDLSN